MKVIINGAGGRMGLVLAQQIEKGCRNAELAAAVDIYAEGFLPTLEAVSVPADCIIDFSNHTGTQALLEYATQKGLPVVVATTGHTQQELELIQAAGEKIPVFHSGNMSLGIALLAQLVRQTVAMFPDADVEIVESHHNGKVDVPSGTALMLARAVQQARPEATLLVGRHENGKRTKQEVGIHSLRMGNTVGIHQVIINTGSQLITLQHEAQDRALFAEGALAAAAFLQGKPAGVYTMEDIVK